MKSDNRDQTQASDETDFAHERFEQIFDDFTSENITRAYEKLSDSVNSFYQKIGSNSLNSEITFYNRNLRLDNKLEAFTGSTSYSIESLEGLIGEHVILFKEPTIVTSVVTSHLKAEKTIKRLSPKDGGYVQVASTGRNTIRPVSRITARGSKLQRKTSTLFKINDVVLGFIIPEEAYIESIEYIPVSELFKDTNKLGEVQSALRALKNEVDVEEQDVSSKFDELQRLVKSEHTKYTNIRNELTLQKQLLASTNESISRAKNDSNNLRSHLTAMQDEVSTANEEIENKAEELRSLKDAIEETKSQVAGIEKARSDKEKELSETTSRVNLVKKELRDAEEEKTLTTLDIDGHRKETRNQLIGYYWLTFSVFAALVGFVSYMYYNAESFESLLPKLVLLEANAWNILISRLPMITATTLVVGGLSTVLFFLIKHIVALNTEKMAMLKASILAQQITDSMECNENMSEKEVINFTRDTKIKLITQVFTQSQSGSVELNTSVLKDIATIIKAGKN